jgi:hypothetical protein
MLSVQDAKALCKLPFRDHCGAGHWRDFAEFRPDFGANLTRHMICWNIHTYSSSQYTMNQLLNALAGVRGAEQQLAQAFLAVAEQGGDGHDFRRGCTVMSGWSQAHLRKIEILIEDFGVPFNAAPDEPATWKQEVPDDQFGLRDFEYLLLLVHQVRGAWSDVRIAARENDANEIIQLATQCASDTDRQIAWLTACNLRRPQVGSV